MHGRRQGPVGDVQHGRFTRRAGVVDGEQGQAAGVRVALQHRDGPHHQHLGALGGADQHLVVVAGEPNAEVALGLRADPRPDPGRGRRGAARVGERVVERERAGGAQQGMMQRAAFGDPSDALLTISDRRKLEVSDLCRVFFGRRGELLYQVVASIYAFTTLWLLGVVYSTSAANALGTLDSHQSFEFKSK